MLGELPLQVSEEVSSWGRAVEHIREVIENIRRLSEWNSQVIFSGMDRVDH